MRILGVEGVRITDLTDYLTSKITTWAYQPDGQIAEVWKKKNSYSPRVLLNLYSSWLQSIFGFPLPLIRESWGNTFSLFLEFPFLLRTNFRSPSSETERKFSPPLPSSLKKTLKKPFASHKVKLDIEGRAFQRGNYKEEKISLEFKSIILLSKEDWFFLFFFAFPLNRWDEAQIWLNFIRACRDLATCCLW